MACREAEPWAYSSSGNKCGCCRVGHGLRYSQVGGGGTWWGNFNALIRPRSSLRPRQSILAESPRKPSLALSGPKPSAVNQPGGTDAAIPTQVIEFGRREPNRAQPPRAKDRVAGWVMAVDG